MIVLGRTRSTEFGGSIKFSSGSGTSTTSSSIAFRTTGSRSNYISGSIFLSSGAATTINSGDVNLQTDNNSPANAD